MFYLGSYQEGDVLTAGSVNTELKNIEKKFMAAYSDDFATGETSANAVNYEITTGTGGTITCGSSCLKLRVIAGATPANNAHKLIADANATYTNHYCWVPGKYERMAGVLARAKCVGDVSNYSGNLIIGFNNRKENDLSRATITVYSDGSVVGTIADTAGNTTTVLDTDLSTQSWHTYGVTVGSPSSTGVSFYIDNVLIATTGSPYPSDSICPFIQADAAANATGDLLVDYIRSWTEEL